MQCDSHQCGLLCSLGADSCSFPDVFALEGSQGAHLEPGNGANWVRAEVRFREERGVCSAWEAFSGPEPLEKEATPHSPIHRVYQLPTATAQEQGKLRHQRTRLASRHPPFLHLIPGCLSMRPVWTPPTRQLYSRAIPGFPRGLERVVLLLQAPYQPCVCPDHAPLAYTPFWDRADRPETFPLPAYCWTSQGTGNQQAGQHKVSLTPLLSSPPSPSASN